MLLRWLLIVWQVFWLVVFIPGHTRGAITLPDGSAGCSLQPAGGCCGSGAQSSGREPTQEDRRRCAVCFLANGYLPPVVYHFDLTLAERTIERPDKLRAQLAPLPFDFPYYPLGPPVATLHFKLV
jgi:hypothetical protein